MKYLGIDWATRTHVTALIDESGTLFQERPVAATWRGVRTLLADLEEHGGADGVLVAIESGAARLTAALVAAGYTVYEINPKQSDRFRDRLSPSGAKDDRRDALVLAHAVRTDRQWLRPARTPSELCRELRIRCRSRVALVAERRRLVQQLRQILRDSYPALLALKRPLWSGLVLELLQRYPDALAARRAQRRGLLALLRRHRIRGLDVEGLRAILREESFALPVGEMRAYADRARDLALSIRHTNDALERADEAIGALFAAHPDREIYLSVPGIGAHLAPYLAAEIESSLGPRPSARALQALAGTSPRTRRSGTQHHGHVSMRKQCHRGLQTALYMVARRSRASSEWAGAYFNWRKARSVRGNTAVRALSNKWAKVLAALLSRGEEYDESKHVEALKRNGVAWALTCADKKEQAA